MKEYHVVVKEIANVKEKKELLTPFSNVTITELKSGTFYEVRLYAVGVKGRKNSESSPALSTQTCMS